MTTSDIKTHHNVTIGDSRCMSELADESIHLIVTSPPYWQLKDYGSEHQIGFHQSYEEYVNNLNLVWSESCRVLHPGCRLCINIGDQFARSVFYGRYKVIPIRTEITKFCETIGLDYMGAIIWQKVTTCNTTGGATIMGSFPYPRNGIIKIDYEFILIFKKPGVAPAVSREIKELSKLTQKEWNEYFTGHWNFSGERQEKHLAMFPVELPKRLIKMFSFVGDTVLDPFLGSGTTSMAARQLKRNSVGYEINREFLPIIKKKLGQNQTELLDDSAIEFAEQPSIAGNLQERIKNLPYIFRDPLKFDKKLDPRKLNFGSRIDSTASDRQLLQRVTQVISPEEIVLEDGLRVRLIGIRTLPRHREQATEYLTQKAKGERVMLKFDSVTRDEKDRLLCYVYLENRTFVNAHLIKSGLVSADVSHPYKFKEKFVSLQTEVSQQQGSR